MLKKLKENKAVKIIGNILYVLSFILVVLILLVVLIQRFSGNDIALGGIRVFYVASGSMLPEYEVGDILISMETDPEDINVGDAVTYLGDEGDIKGRVVTHEVIEKRQNENGQYVFVTKGTANTIADPEITEDQVYGKVVYRTALLSAICKLLQNIYGFYFLIIVPLAIIIAKILFNFLISRAEKREEESENEENEDSEDSGDNKNAEEDENNKDSENTENDENEKEIDEKKQNENSKQLNINNNLMVETIDIDIEKQGPEEAEKESQKSKLRHN